MKVGYRSSVTC